MAFLFELKRLFDQYIETSDRRRKMDELREAIKNARETRDTSKIELLLRDITGSK